MYIFPFIRIRYFILFAINTHIDCLTNSKCSVRYIFKATKQGALKVTLHHFLLLALIIFLPALFFSSLTVPSAAFCHGEYGSVCLTWQSACLAFHLNSPITCSLAPSIIRVLGTPSCANKSDHVSCAYFSLPLGMPYTMYSCGHNPGHIYFLCVKQSLPQVCQ